MRAVLLVFLAAIIGFTGTFANAAGLNSDDSIKAGFHEVVVEDTIDFFKSFSYLEVYSSDKVYSCLNTSTGRCKKLEFGSYNSIFPVCQSKSDVNCIDSLVSRDASGTQRASFEAYSMPTHPQLFRSNIKGLPRKSESISTWQIPGLDHGDGTQYAVYVGASGEIGEGKIRTFDLYAQVYAISEVVGRGPIEDQNGFANYAKCTIDSKTRQVIGCGTGGNIETEVCVVQFEISGNCGAKRTLPEKTNFELSIRLEESPNGWYHGRLGDPKISFGKSGGASLLKVSGTPVSVPVASHSGLWPSFSTETKKFWNACVKNDACPKSTRFFRVDNSKLAGEDRNITSEQKGWTPLALETVRAVNRFTNSTATSIESVWSLRTLSSRKTQSNRCYSAKGFKGLITTNATSYTDGPPILSKGTLNYSLAAPALVAGQEDEIGGSYDVVLAMQFAKCIYGNAVISPKASISVLTVKGDQKVATEITSRSKDWVRLSAKNFSYLGK